jgi:hypothetical protein
MQDPLSVSIASTPVAPRPSYPTRKLLRPSPDHPDDYIIELDYSSLSKFMECPRMAENYLIRSREANKDQSATDFGKLFHTLEERRLATGALTDEVKKKQHEDIASHFLTHQVPATDHRTQDRMVQTIKLYNERYEKDAFPQKVLQVEGKPFVERAFKIELCTLEVNTCLPYNFHELVIGQPTKSVDLEVRQLYVRNLHILYTGRIDAVLQETNLLFVLDHKTSSRGGRTFEEAFRLSLQTRGYCWAAQKLLGLPVAGLIMNAVIIRPLTKTGTGTEFNRITYFYRPDQLDEFELCAKAAVSSFVSMLVSGYFPQYARSFKSPCEMCDYQENCSLSIHQRTDDLASELYRDVTWNPVH